MYGCANLKKIYTACTVQMPDLWLFCTLRFFNLSLDILILLFPKPGVRHKLVISRCERGWGCRSDSLIIGSVCSLNIMLRRAEDALKVIISPAPCIRCSLCLYNYIHFMPTKIYPSSYRIPDRYVCFNKWFFRTV